MASPISKSPRRGRSPSPRSPRYKFTIFPPDVYAPITLNYMPATDKSYKFCSFLKDKFETHFGMNCSLPTAAGTAYIGDFDEFERMFLIDAEYIVVVVTQKSVSALRKFYPRLLVFVTVRPEWVNRFILVFVGDVAVHPSVDLSVLIHQPIIFKESDWEADLETWKALHKLLKVEWTPHKEDEPSPTRRGEVLSVIQRTVVETEVQEVRTRRRSSSRNSDNGSATPGTLSPLPGASRKLLAAPGDGTDLHIVSPSVEKPKVVEEMSSGRRRFGGGPEVESSKPIVLESTPPPSKDRTTTPKVVIERPNDNGTTTKASTSTGEKEVSSKIPISKKEVSEPKVESQRTSGEKSRPSDLFGAGNSAVSEKPKEKRQDKRDSWKFASEVRTKKSRDKPSEQRKTAQDEDGTALEEEITASKGRTIRSTPQTKLQQEPAFENQTEKPGPVTGLGDKSGKTEELITPERKSGQQAAKQEIIPERKIENTGVEPKTKNAVQEIVPETKMEKTFDGRSNDDKETSPVNKGDKESVQDSVQTSGYSSLDSSISIRSMGQIPSTPVSIKVSPFEGESSTDVSYVTAPETLSLPAPQQAPGSSEGIGEKPVETPEISDLASLPSETEDKQEVEAFQLTKESNNTQKTSTTLGQSIESLAVAVGRLVWPVGTNSNGKPNRPFRITLILATATALSPIYRQLSLSFFEMLSAFLWPSVEGMIESGVVSFPVSQIAADARFLVTDTFPQLTTLSVVSPSQFGRSSPTELFLPTRFVFWVTSPPQ